MNFFKFTLPLIALIAISGIAVQCTENNDKDHRKNNSDTSSTRSVNTKAILAQTQTTVSRTTTRRNNANTVRQGSALVISLLAGGAFLSF